MEFDQLIISVKLIIVIHTVQVIEKVTIRKFNIIKMYALDFLLILLMIHNTLILFMNVIFNLKLVSNYD